MIMPSLYNLYFIRMIAVRKENMLGGKILIAYSESGKDERVLISTGPQSKSENVHFEF